MTSHANVHPMLEVHAGYTIPVGGFAIQALIMLADSRYEDEIAIGIQL